jgi:hypothetical protein
MGIVFVAEQREQPAADRRFGHGCGLSNQSCGTPPRDLEVLAKERIEYLLSRLQNARLRSMAVWKWEGYSNEEIACTLGCCFRTIARKLELIRNKEEA